MPVSHEDLLKALNKQDNKEWLRHRADWKFLRSALDRALVGNKEGAMEYITAPTPLRQEENPDARDAFAQQKNLDSYLIKQPVESDLSYAIRLIFAFDGNESYQTLRTLIGYLLKDSRTDWQGFSSEYLERMQKNIDGEQTGWKEFVEEAAEEIAGIGKSYGWLYTPQGEKVPVHEFVEREKVRDWQKDRSNFLYVKFEDCREAFSGVLRNEVHRTIVLTPEAWYFCTPGELDTWNIEEIPFTGKFVPFVDGWCGRYAKSVVSTAAHLQFLLMNADSVAFQIIRNQMIAIITGPSGTRDQLREITTNTVVDIPSAASRGLEIVGYPKQTIDGHMDYLKRMGEKVNRSANLRDQIALAASGESKDWDFMPTGAMLDRLADHVESYVNGVLTMFERFAGMPLSKDKRFSINRNFDKKGLKETLDLIFQGIALQLGKTMNDKLKVHASKLFEQIGVPVSEADLETIASEIESMGESDTLKNLLEVSLNGQNKTTVASPAADGAGEGGQQGTGGDAGS